MNFKLSIIFPCFNEEESVNPVLSESIILIEGRKDIEILVVDDGSTDRTLDEIQKFEKQVRLIRHERNLGYGAAIKTGLFYSKGEAVTFMDFDGTCSPSESLDMLKHLAATGADMVMGIRLHDQSQMPKTRWIGNQLYRGLLKSLYPGQTHLPKDVCTGFRLLRRPVAEELFEGLPDDLSFSPALTAKAIKRQCKIAEYQITYKERFGQSKISLLKDGIRFGQALVSQRFIG